MTGTVTCPACGSPNLAAYRNRRADTGMARCLDCGRRWPVSPDDYGAVCIQEANQGRGAAEQMNQRWAAGGVR